MNRIGFKARAGPFTLKAAKVGFKARAGPLSTYSPCELELRKQVSLCTSNNNTGGPRETEGWLWSLPGLEQILFEPP